MKQPLARLVLIAVGLAILALMVVLLIKPMPKSGCEARLQQLVSTEIEGNVVPLKVGQRVFVHSVNAAGLYLIVQHLELQDAPAWVWVTAEAVDIVEQNCIIQNVE
jgi:hypothetical protein